MFQAFWGSFFPFLLLILTGFISKKTGLLKPDDRKVINKLIINLTLPLFIFNVFLKAPLELELLKIPALAWLVMVGAGLLAFAASFWVNKPSLKGGFFLVAVLGNTGYLGYPLTNLLYGEKALSPAIFYDVFGTVLFTFTLGLLVAQHFGGRREKLNLFKEIFSFPPIIALLLGLVFNLSGIHLPEFLSLTLKTLGEVSIPLMMISIGLSLELAIFTFLPLILLVLLIKLIFSPFLAHYFSLLIGLEENLYKVGLLEASMPSMMLSLIIGERYSLDIEFIASAIFFTTLFSFLTIPLLQSIFS